jgi:hypothetical protein
MKPFHGIALIGAMAAALLAGGPVSGAPDMRRYGPIHSTSPDSGTCGNFWANDTFDRVFRVDTTPQPDGTFLVTEYFRRGTFVTVEGPSPGGCQTNPGGTVAAGVTGTMFGTFRIEVSGGTYDPSATCTEASCGTTAGFVSTVFGPAATYDVPTFLLYYNAGANGRWRNASADRGGNRGDITGAP